MKHLLKTLVLSLGLPVALTLTAPAPAAAASTCPGAEPNAPSVACGTDYFQTQAGTSFDFNGMGGLGVVDFTGLAFGPGQTDTIIQRTSDITIGATNTSPNLLITGLQLVSTSSVTVGAYTGLIYISLDGSPTGAQDTGTMDINGSLAGGTFSSTLDVFFDICTAPGANGVGCGSSGTLLGTDDISLSNGSNGNGASWSPTAALGDMIVNGTDENGGDQAANCHSYGSNQNCLSAPAAGSTSLDVGNEVDFFVTTLTETHPSPGGQHVAGDAPIPEPGTLMLFGPAPIALVGLRRRLAKRAV